MPRIAVANPLPASSTEGHRLSTAVTNSGRALVRCSSMVYLHRYRANRWCPVTTGSLECFAPAARPPRRTPRTGLHDVHESTCPSSALDRCCRARSASRPSSRRVPHVSSVKAAAFIRFCCLTAGTILITSLPSGRVSPWCGSAGKVEGRGATAAPELLVFGRDEPQVLWPCLMSKFLSMRIAVTFW